MEIFVIVAVTFLLIIFTVLTVVIAQALFAVRQTLNRIDQINLDVSMKLNLLNSTFETISNVGDMAKCETEKMKIAQQNHQNKIKKESCETADLAEWLIASVKIGNNFLRRKSHESQ